MPSSFNIVALGPPTSGKTVYIATLHQVIGVGELAPGISFTTSHTERARLQEVYDQVVNPNTGWPPSTYAGDPMRETKFTCTVEWTGMRSRFSRGLRRFAYPVFDITYVDYAGEWIPEAHRAEPQLINAFERRLRDAHAILGIIDGMRLRQYLEGDGAGRDFFHDRIRPIVETMRSHPVPIHFVITKWDLLGDYTLDEIQARLLGSRETGFRELIEARTVMPRWGRKPVGHVRIIPVSSVGDFASLESDWQVTKVAGRKPTHVNVEIPLVAAVSDICDLALSELRQQQAARSGGRSKRRSPVPDKGGSSPDIKLSTSGVEINLTATIAFAFGAGVEISRQLGRPAAKAGHSMRRQYRRIRSQGIRGVKSDEAALFYVVRAFRDRQAVFENQVDYQAGRIFSPDRAEDIDFPYSRS